MSFFNLKDYFNASILLSEIKNNPIQDFEFIFDKIAYYEALSYFFFDKKKSLKLFKNFRSKYISSKYVLNAIEYENGIYFDDFTYNIAIMEWSSFLKQIEQSELAHSLLGDIQIKLYYYIARSYEMLKIYDKSYDLFKKVLFLENSSKSNFFTLKILDIFKKSLIKWDMKISFEDRIFISELILNQRQNDLQYDLQLILDLILKYNDKYQLVNNQDLIIKKWILLYQAFIEMNDFKMVKFIFENYLKFVFESKKTDIELIDKLNFAHLSFLIKDNLTQAIIFLKENPIYIQKISIINLELIFRDLLKNIELDILKNLIRHLIQIEKYVALELFLYYSLENNFYHFITGIFSDNEIFDQIKNKNLRSKILFWTAKSYLYLEDKDNAIQFFKKNFLAYQFSYYGVQSIKYLEEYLNTNQLFELYQQYDSDYKSFIHSNQFQQKLNNLFLAYDFSLEKNIFFKKFLFYIYIGEFYTAIQYFEYYKKNFQEKNQYEIFLVFSKLFSDMGFFQLSIDYIYKLFEYLNLDHSNYYEFDFFVSLKYPIFYKEAIQEILKNYKNIELSRVLSYIYTESRFFRLATSQSGAIGLMQLMPKTAFEINNKLKLNIINNKEIYNEENNLKLGIFYLNFLENLFNDKKDQEYNSILRIGGYNAGPNRMNQYLSKYRENFQKNKTLINDKEYFIEKIPNTETREYVKKLTQFIHMYKKVLKVD